MLDIGVALNYSLPINIQHIQLVLPPSQGDSGATLSAGPLGKISLLKQSIRSFSVISFVSFQD